MIHVRELQPDDAPAVAAVESRYHQQLADGERGHRRYLTDAIAAGVNLSVGLFDDDRLVGYLLCYGFGPTIFPGETGEALYIEDIAVLPRYRRLVPQLIRRFGLDARRHFAGSTVEAHATESVFKVWRDHPAFFASGGYAITRHADSGEMLKGEIRYLVRWQPILDWEAPVPSVEELVGRLRGHAVDVDGVRYEAKLVRDERDWEALASLWDRLLLAVPDHTVFQTYEYQRLWWRHFGGDNQLFIVLLVRGGEVRGIAPLQIETVKEYGRWLRRLAFIGSRWEVDRPRLLFPGEESSQIRALVGFLAARADKWDFCDFHEQPTGSETLATLESAFRSAGWLVGQTRDSDCAYLELRGTWADFFAGKSQTFRKNIKTAGRRLRAAGEVEYRVYDTLPEVLEQLEIYRGIEARSWKSGEGVGVSRSDDYFAFYREMAERFAGRRAFVVRMLSVGGRPVAGTFGLSHEGVYYSLQIAHDTEFSRSSPGTYLEALEMEQCYGDGFREYEFLGGFLNNKSRWTSTYRFTTQLHVYRRTPFFLALHTLVFGLKPRLKALVRPYMRSWRRRPAERAVEGD
jgi:CelD/BcsL family acetyltransferase involved in cellulose biosynthesis